MTNHEKNLSAPFCAENALSALSALSEDEKAAFCAFCEENKLSVLLSECFLHEEARRGEDYEIRTQTEIREEWEEFHEDYTDFDGQPYPDFEPFYEDVTGMGAYYQVMVSRYYGFSVDGVQWTDENLFEARFEDLCDCLTAISETLETLNRKPETVEITIYNA